MDFTIDKATLILLVAAVIYLVSLAVLVWNKWKKRIATTKQKPGENVVIPLDLNAAIENIKQVFRKLNIEFIENKPENKNELPSIDFTYQTGKFTVAFFNAEHKCARLVFPGINVVDMSNIDLVRTVCNESNCVSPLTNVVYNVHSKDNDISLHIIHGFVVADNIADNQRILTQVLNNCFAMRQDVNERLEKMLEATKLSEKSDLEYAHACDERIEKLLADAEIAHTEVVKQQGEENLPSEESDLHLGAFLMNQQVDLGIYDIVRMEVESDDGYSYNIDKAEDILNYSLIDAIVHSENHNISELTTAYLATIVITYADKAAILDEHKVGTHQLIITIERNITIDDDKIVYMRVSYMLPQININGLTKRFITDGPTHILSGSVLIGYDGKSQRQRKSEFKYMWQDAQDKADENNTEGWTPEQRLVYNITNDELGYQAYFGKMLYRQERYYEASNYLMRAWVVLNRNYDQLNKNSEKFFYEICFLLGSCYHALGKLTEATYYLQIADRGRQVNYTEAYINCLIANADLRASEVIDDNLNAIDAQVRSTQEDEPIPDYVHDFYNYLRRRDVFLKIELKHLDVAEQHCKMMLDEPVNKEFAQNELEYIKKLREHGVENVDLKGDDYPF